MTSIVEAISQEAYQQSRAGSTRQHAGDDLHIMTTIVFEILRKRVPLRELSEKRTGLVHLDNDADEHGGEPIPRALQVIIDDLWPEGMPSDLPQYDHTHQLYLRIAATIAETVVVRNIGLQMKLIFA